MSKTPYDDLRWCDRQTHTQIFHHVEAFAKKIRKRKDFCKQDKEQVINANAEQNQIDVFYKEGWEYDHAHASLSCDISDPLYIQAKYQSEGNQELAQYYAICKSFIERLRSQHEDETAFRVQSVWARPLVHIPTKDWPSDDTFTESQKKNYQNITCSKNAYKSFLDTIEYVLERMHENAKKYSSLDKQNLPYLRIIQLIQTIEDWAKLLKEPERQEGEDEQYKQPQKHTASIYQFMANFIWAAEQIRDKRRSCLFNYQPEISILTYLIHPALLGLYGFYHKEKIMWKNQYEHNLLNINFNQPIQSPPLLDDLPHFQITRTVFINFDGYESQFNIQFAKNMENHLMYISFPKFDKSSSEENMPFNNRFFKKIFFNYSRDLYEYNNEEFDVVENVDLIKQSKDNQRKQSDEMDEEDIDIRRQFQLKFDPEKYFQSVKNIYKNKQQAEKNKNIFILPISFKYLQEQFANLFSDKCGDASKYASYFIWFTIRDFLYDDIRKFNPNMIVISYSGVLHIKEQHFVKITQQLANISRRKMVFYPNFSTQLIQPDTFESYEQYDNFLKPKQTIDKSCNVDLLRKFSQFLKISSGTYNLEVSRDKETIVPRFKIAKLNNYTRGLLSALSHQEYEHLRNRVSDLVLRSETVIISKSVEESMKEIKNSTSPYYQTMIKCIREMLSNEYAQCPSDIADLVDAIRLQIKSTSGSKQTKDNYINDIQQKIELQLASQKYSEIAYVYFKTRNDKKQYDQLKQYMKTENQSQESYLSKKISNNLSGILALSLRNKENKEKISMSVTPRTQLVYKTDQRHRMSSGRKSANFMLMNYLENNVFVSYAGAVNLATQMEGENNKISTQRVEMYPIVFANLRPLNGEFAIRNNWNYAETSRYYILYWPQEYNILEATLREINDQIYEPRALAEIYVCEIPDTKEHRLTFHLANMNEEDIIPRRFCSALELFNENKIFILGGFYDRENNYLSLQRDITGVDLSHYNGENHKCMISKEKDRLYSKEGYAKTGEKGKPDSYVRARRQYEFYDLEELCDLTEQEKQMQTQTRTYIMLGGFGEDFVRPFSLMSCNYYVINVHLPTMKISSIQRKMVYENIITSNIKGFVKNNGYFPRMPLYQKNSLRPDEFIGTEEYIAHRSVYSLARQTNKPEELKAKTKYFFALDIYNSYKKQYKIIATKIGEYLDIRTNDTSQFLLSHSPQGNHYLIIRKNKSEEEIAQIYLQKMLTKTTVQPVPLTHGSIVSIDIRFKLIYAIVKHDLYTNGKYVLTQCEMPSEQSEVVLKIIQQLNYNLSQHRLFSPRPNEILLLHGLTFSGVNISDMVYKVLKKQNTKENPLKMIPFPQTISSREFKKCFTLMIKDENRQSKALEVVSVNILFPQELKASSYYVRKYRLRLSTQVSQFAWEEVSEYPLVLVDEQTRTQLHIARIDQTRLFQSQQSSSSYSTSTFSSPAVIAMCNRVNCGIILKVTCYKKNTYIGMVSSHNYDLGNGSIGMSMGIGGVSSMDSAEMESMMMKEKAVKEPLKILMVNSENKDARRIWELCTPLTGYTKSIDVYKDMEVPLQAEQ